MNILLIGNGFDLAHGLPTKYTDFLEWVKKFQDFYLYATERLTASYKEADSPIFQYFNNLLYEENNNDICDEIYNLTHENVWIEYFLENPLYQKENWIDFESEISTVIQSIEKSMGTDNFYEPVFVLENKFFNNKYTNNIPEYYNAIYREEQEKIRKPTITYEGLRDKLLLDLKKLSRVLEIYLTDYVEQLDCKLLSPDIQRLLPKECMRVSGMPVYNVFVLSFNYTNTYQKLYVEKLQTSKFLEKNIDYIHGKADINNDLDTNNMVLGIDEYLKKNEKNKKIEFIAFKKYYQRIYKGTGCKYKDWIDEIKQKDREYKNTIKEKQKTLHNKSLSSFVSGQIESELKKLKMNPPKHNLYIFGHSLDITDRDILREFILNDSVTTIIYYFSRDDLSKKIANLVKVIGKDELIRRTGGSTKTIEFKLQQDMIEKEN